MNQGLDGLWATSDRSTAQTTTTTTTAPGGLATSTTTASAADLSGALQGTLDALGLSMAEAELILQALYVAGTVGVAFALFLGGGQ